VAGDWRAIIHRAWFFLSASIVAEDPSSDFGEMSAAYDECFRAIAKPHERDAVGSFLQAG
jgi:hypothetical protein